MADSLSKQMKFTCRPPMKGVPAHKPQRDRMLRLVSEYVRRHKLVPPLSLEELRKESDRLIESEALAADSRDWLAVLINNETWRDSLGGIPCDRRLLLLPQCLRKSTCPAGFDELGLLCRECGQCMIGAAKSEAERLGYVVLVAEGSPVVTSLIASGKVQAVIGVSCLDSLESVYKYMEAAAVPGIAIPLLYDGCHETMCDLDWLWEAIQLTREEGSSMLDIESIRREVIRWFDRDAMEQLLGPVSGKTGKIAVDWMARAGKRWRPVLTVCTARALAGDELDQQDLRRVALGVECFHKASLVHDDIEDGDDTRYGEKTLHVEHGQAVAINIGDLLLGDGYRLLAETGLPAAKRADMMQVAADGHRQLCIGQGAELCWARQRQPLHVADVLEIFRGKTAPAFEVALQLGAILADAPDAVRDVLSHYSEALGIAYQVRDDLQDFYGSEDPSDVMANRPSVVLAVAWERADGEDRKLIEELWCGGERFDTDPARWTAIFKDLRVRAVTESLLEGYKAEAIRALCRLDNLSLKGLLRKMIAKVFREAEGFTCCEEHDATNEGGSRSGSDSAA
ncbi:MAG: polyprenyl synthetase family protein [Phycisphaerae bacterium]